MPDPSTDVFVRRGDVVKGPVPLAKVVALLKAGTLKLTDQVANSPSGPWRALKDVVSPGNTALPVVESFTIKRSMFGGRYVAYYQCVKCGESLQSSEGEMMRVETCTTCGRRYRLSSRAAEQAKAAKSEHEKQQAMAAAAAQQDRDRKVAERREAAARRDEERRRQEESQKHEETNRIASERHLVERAAAARSRDGACWYCGCSRVTRLPQCPACRMLIDASVTEV